MTPEERELLERAVELGEENQKVLKSIKRSMTVSRVIRILYWVVIIGASVGLFYFFQPYIDKTVSFYGGLSDGVGDVNSFLDSFNNSATSATQ